MQLLREWSLRIWQGPLQMDIQYMTICQKKLIEVLYQLLIISVDLVVFPLRYEAARN